MLDETLILNDKFNVSPKFSSLTNCHSVIANIDDIHATANLSVRKFHISDC